MMEAHAIQLYFALSRKLFPLKKVPKVSASEMKALQKTYAKWDLIALPFFFVYAPLAGYFWFLALRSIGRIVESSHNGFVFLEFPSEMFWIIPSIFLGIFTSALPVHLTCRLLLGKRYPEYERWHLANYQFDTGRAFLFLAVLFMIGVAIFSAGGLMVWDEFHQDRLVMMRPWYWNAKTYPYARIKTIARIAKVQAPIGTIFDRPYYAIRFDDGTTWTSHQQLSDSDHQRDSAIIDLVSSQSGQPIQQVDLIDDLKP